MKSLTIVIPTYNRAACLQRLLDTLAREIEGIEDRVDILISDNASPDDTPAVTAAFQARLPSATVLRQEVNLGPDENFCRCVERVATPYFWFVGDDDLPRAGAVRYVVSLVDAAAPDLVYLESAWRPALTDNDPANPVPAAIAPLTLDRMAFARRVNVWSTFISGLVVRRDVFVTTASAEDLRRHAKTNLVQLSWVLGTLERGRTLLYVPTPCILATEGNTGGYAVLQVFGRHFPAIVAQRFGARAPITRAIVRRCVICFLPHLMWALRFGRVGTFDYEDPSSTLRPELGRYFAFRLLVAIGRSPRPIAKAALRLSTLASRVLRVHDRVLEALGGRRAPA